MQLKTLVFILLTFVLFGVNIYIHRHQYWRWFIRYIFSNVVNFLTKRPKCKINRSKFMSFDWKVESNKLPDGHSHPNAANERNSVSKLIGKFIDSIGRERYDISTSSREDCRGQRLYYGLKDVSQTCKSDTIKDGDIVTMVDVDYYLSYDDFAMHTSHRDFIIYTFCPTTLAGGVKDGRFYHLDESVVVTRMNGGEIYYHQTFDWCNRTVIAIPHLFSYDIYNIDKIDLGDNRYVILGSLAATVYDPTFISYFVLTRLENMMLKRYVARHGNTLHFIYLNKKNKFVRSIQRIGTKESAEVPEDVFTAIWIIYSVAKHNNISDVERYFKVLDYMKARAMILAPIVYIALGEIKMETAIISGVAAPAYNCLTDEVSLDVDDKVSARAVGPSVVMYGGPSPVDSYSNDIVTVKERIEKVHNNKIPPKKYSQYAREFCDLLVPISLRHVGIPLSADEVIERQDRKSQRSRSYLQLFWTHVPFLVKCFQKREVYQKIGAPRNISTVTNPHTIRLSAFTYAFKEAILKPIEWFIPGRTPKEVCLAVRNFCSQNQRINSSDYSAFDGTNSKWLRENVEMRVYKLYFSEEYHTELVAYINDELEGTAVTRHGVVYKPDGSRLSGSPLTTDGNTILNAFSSYCAYRNMGLNSRNSFKSIGPKYGDDSLEKAACPIETSSKDLGLDVKSDIRGSGEVPFLGRIFINPWVSDATVQDPMRTMLKIHQSTGPKNVDDVILLRNKLIGYQVTDGNTPLIGDYCQKMLEFLDEGPYQFGYDTELDKKLLYGPWPAQFELWDEKHRVVAESCGLTVADLNNVIDKIHNAANTRDIEWLINNELSVKIPAITGGRVVTP